jgi:hypothetical protein
MTDSPWSYHQLNERSLQIISQCRQSKIITIVMNANSFEKATEIAI